MKKMIFAALAGSMMLSGAAMAQDVVVDSFETYSVQADLTTAAHFGAVTGSWVIDTVDVADGTKALKQVAETSSQVTGGFPIVLRSTLNAGNPLVVQFALFDSDATVQGITNALNTRAALNVGSYDGGTWGAGALGNFFAFGLYFAAPANGTDYAHREVRVAGWLPSGITRTTGWHTMRMVIDDTAVSYFVDGTPSAENGQPSSLYGTTEMAASTADGFNSIRIGSQTAGADFLSLSYDNLVIGVGLSTNVEDWHLN